MGLDNERRRDIVWASFVMLAVFVPIIIFCIDVYFYIKSSDVLDTLMASKEACADQVEDMLKYNQTVDENENWIGFTEQQKDDYRSNRKLLSNFHSDTIENFRYSLDGRFRPCLLLSLILLGFWG